MYKYETLPTNLILEIIQLPITKFENNGITLQIKFDHASENGYGVQGDDWSNLVRKLFFKITYEQLVRDGWRKVMSK